MIEIIFFLGITSHGEFSKELTELYRECNSATWGFTPF